MGTTRASVLEKAPGYDFHILGASNQGQIFKSPKSGAGFQQGPAAPAPALAAPSTGGRQAASGLRGARAEDRLVQRAGPRLSSSPPVARWEHSKA